VAKRFVYVLKNAEIPPRAVAFERYLKSGSGVAFAQRHLR
jgi:hypothetical protein